MKTILKLPFKLIAIPFVIILTILGAFAKFFFTLSGGILSIISALIGIGGLALLFTGDLYGGIVILVTAFIISPYGLPAIAEWVLARLDDLNYSLKRFITS